MFDRHRDAELAIRGLGLVGFEMKKLSIVGRERHTEEHATAAFWRSIFSILAAPAFFWIPAIGPILTGGLIGSALMGTLEGAAVGAAVVGGTGALAAALASIGIPKDSVVRYEIAVMADSFVLIASGTLAEVEAARETLAGLGARVETHAR